MISRRLFTAISVTCTVTILSMLVCVNTARAATTDEEFTQATLAEVVPLFEKGDFQTAYKRLWEMVQEHPDNAELNFKLGEAAYGIGRYEAAAAAFERVLIANPDAHRAKLELGKTFFQLKSYLLAREAFEEVLKANPPPPVAEKIKEFLSAIDNAMSVHRFSGRIGLGWQYDSNVAAAPGDALISTNIGDFTLSGDSVPKQDTAAIAQLSLNHLYDPGQEGGIIWQDNLSLYHTSYKHQTKYNLDVLSLNSGLGYSRNGNRIHLPLTLDVIQLNNEPYARYWGLAPSIGYQPLKNLDITLTGTLQRREYPKQKDRDGAYWSAELTPRLIFRNGAFVIQGTAKYADEETRENDQSNRSWEGGIGILAQLPYDIVLFVQQSIKTSDYREAQSLFENSRKDQENRTLVNLSKQLWRGFSLTLSYVYTRNHSNLDLYDYDRKQLTALISWEF